jgi:hypothetical protein
MTCTYVQHAPPAQCSDLQAGNLRKIDVGIRRLDRHFYLTGKPCVARSQAILNNRKLRIICR